MKSVKMLLLIVAAGITLTACGSLWVDDYSGPVGPGSGYDLGYGPDIYYNNSTPPPAPPIVGNGPGSVFTPQPQPQPQPQPTPPPQSNPGGPGAGGPDGPQIAIPNLPPMGGRH